MRGEREKVKGQSEERLSFQPSFLSFHTVLVDLENTVWDTHSSGREVNL